MRLLLISICCLVLITGCSSLPKDALQTTEQSSQAHMFLEKGHQYYHSSQYKKAAASLNKALSLGASVDDELTVARALSSLGRVHLATGEIPQAEACFQQAYQAASGVNQTELLAQTLGGLGAVQLHRNHPQEAQTYLKSALELPLENPGNTRATLLHDLGSAHRKQGDNATAESYYLQALEMHEPLRDLKGIATDCYSLALLYQDEGHLDMALQKARRALNHDKKTQKPSSIAQDLTLLGILSLSLGENDEAGDYLRRAKLAWQSLGREDQVTTINDHLQRIHSP